MGTGDLEHSIAEAIAGKRGLLARPKRILTGYPGATQGEAVAMPNVVQDQKRELPIYLIFTGLNLDDVNKRWVLIAEMNENFAVKEDTIRVLLSSDHFGTYGVNSVRVWYDDKNDGWFMLVTHYNKTDDRQEVAFLRWNKDFTAINYEHSPMEITPSGAASELWLPRDMIGAYITLNYAPNWTNARVIGLNHIQNSPTAGDPEGNYWVYCGDLHAEPPVFERSRIPALKMDTGPRYYKLYEPTLVDIGDHIVGLMSGFQGSNPMGMTAIVVNNKDYLYSEDLDRLQGIASSPVGELWHHLGGHLIHPYLTTLPDHMAYNLFCTLEGRGTFLHEIWSLRVNPSALRPENQEAIYWLPWSSQSISGGDTTYPFNGEGTKTIYFTSDTSGDLTVQMNPTGRSGDWFDLFTRTGITSTVEQTSYEAFQMRLKFSAAATVTATVVQSLR